MAVNLLALNDVAWRAYLQASLSNWTQSTQVTTSYQQILTSRPTLTSSPTSWWGTVMPIRINFRRTRIDMTI